MLRHVVLFQTQPEVDEATVDAAIERLRALDALPGVVGLRAGRDVSHRGDYDLGLTCDFAGPAELKAYLEHPDHVAVVQDVLPGVVRQGWQVVDFWTGDEPEEVR